MIVAHSDAAACCWLQRAGVYFYLLCGSARFLEKETALFFYRNVLCSAPFLDPIALEEVIMKSPLTCLLVLLVLERGFKTAHLFEIMSAPAHLASLFLAHGPISHVCTAVKYVKIHKYQ